MTGLEAPVVRRLAAARRGLRRRGRRLGRPGRLAPGAGRGRLATARRPARVGSAAGPAPARAGVVLATYVAVAGRALAGGGR